jgi:hypothetical protein
MTAFALKVELDPEPDDRAALERWPRPPLMADISTVASGWISIELDGRPILYDNGRLVASSTRPGAARIGDYVIIFLQRLLDAACALGDRAPHVVEFGDNPACLVLVRTDDCVRVSYRESPADADVGAATLPESAFLGAVKQAASHYLEELLTLNPALREHPDVKALREGLRAL